MRAPRNERIATVLGGINVTVAGTGPAMACWPSLLMTGDMWRAQTAYFGDRYQVILIDPPGHGGSEKLTRHFTIEECSVCLAQVLDGLAIEECVLVGSSWGGMVDGVFAARYPERTRAAVLMNCTASPAPLRQRIEFFGLTSALRALGTVPEMLVDHAVAAFVGPTTERDRRDAVEFIRSAVRRVDARSVRWAIESVVTRRRDQRPLMGAITCPVLVLAAEEDRTFPVAETRAMAEAIPGSRFQVLSAAGHLAAVEAPEAINSAVDNFLVSLARHPFTTTTDIATQRR